MSRHACRLAVKGGEAGFLFSLARLAGLVLKVADAFPPACKFIFFSLCKVSQRLVYLQFHLIPFLGKVAYMANSCMFYLDFRRKNVNFAMQLYNKAKSGLGRSQKGMLLRPFLLFVERMRVDGISKWNIGFYPPHWAQISVLPAASRYLRRAERP